MKSILLSIKPEWYAKILNGEKTIEIRKNKALASAIQKLINEYGYADIYVYCSKSNTQYLVGSKTQKCEIITKSPNARFSPNIDKYTGNGKVLFKFRCYKVEEIETCERHSPELLNQSCLNANEFYDYLTKGRNFLGQVLGYAIHISDLEIFDRPKELSELKYPHSRLGIPRWEIVNGNFVEKRIRKAPQNYCYIEGE